jgi:hypothetical protein
MPKIPFHRKQPTASNDYELAYNTINTIRPGKSIDIEPINLSAFRKYAYDLAAKCGKDISTRKLNDSELTVYCLK